MCLSKHFGTNTYREMFHLSIMHRNTPSRSYNSGASVLSLEESAVAGLSDLCEEKDDVSSMARELSSLFAQCPVDECPLHTETHHLLMLYSNALFCLMHHGMGKLSERTFLQICMFEGVIMQNISIHSQASIQYNNMDLYCEQDVESLAFKAFIELTQRSSSILGNPEAVCAMLQLLYLRKEYERFFQVYGMKIERTLDVFKIALQATLKTKEKGADSVFASLREYLGLAVSDVQFTKADLVDSVWMDLVSRGHSEVDPFQLPLSEKKALYRCVKAWYNQKYKEHHWNFSLEKWRVSKDTEGSSEAMLDICMKFQEHEKGWKIYKESFLETLHTLRMYRLSCRAVCLIVKAINMYGTPTWTERLLEVCTVISRLPIDKHLKIKNTFSVLLNIDRYLYLSFAMGAVIQQYPSELISSQTVGTIFQDTVQMVYRHREEIEREIAQKKLPDIFKPSVSLYALWKQKTTKGIFATLIFGRSKECVNVYSQFLQITILLNLHPQMFCVCQDLWEAGLHLTPPLSDALDHVHSLVCECSKYSNEEVHSRRFLTHILSKSSKMR
ncbi:hypothetical protein NECID01_0388 [Nematocida sp. AWRm77]|nr:hypothetical protein NECID01_0388 [Nematocida sp. AWRm77]